MFTIYEVYDPDSPGYRKLFTSAEGAKKYWDGVTAEYGTGINIQSHTFEDVDGLLAFIEQDLRGLTLYEQK